MKINLNPKDKDNNNYCKLLLSILQGKVNDNLDNITVNDIEKIRKYIKYNKISLVNLSPEITTIIKNNVALKQIYEEQKLRLEYILRTFEIIKKQFIAEKIPFIFIKSPGYFPLFSDNLDIIINPKNSIKAKKILEKNNYFELFKWSEPFKAYYRKYENTSEILSIHLHEKVAWDGNIFLDHDFCFNDAQEMNSLPGYYMPGVENSIIITLAHSLYENKYILLGDYQKILYLFKNQNVDISKVLKRVKQYNWEDGFKYIIQKYLNIEKSWGVENGINCFFNKKYSHSHTIVNKYFPYKINKYKSRGLFICKMLRDEAVPVQKKIKWTIGTFSLAIKRKFKISMQSQFKVRQTAFIVSFSGVDNSGKTTLAQSVEKIMNDCDFKTVYLWNRVGSSSIFLRMFTSLFNLFRKDKDSKGTGDTFRRSSRFDYLQNNILLKYIWLFVSLSDYILIINFKILYNVLLGKVVLLDRYYYDVVDEISAIVKNKKKMERRISKLILFKPDVAFYLYIYDIESCTKYSGNLFYISKDNSIGENINYCCYEIFKKYQNKWKNKHIISGILNNPIK